MKDISHHANKNNKEMPVKLRSNLIWFGGKAKMAKTIIDLMPEHKTYVEVFGGGANVLLQKEKKHVEVYNDINGDVVNYLMVLRADPDKFYKAAESLPYSREIYEKWRKEDLPADEFERAVRWFYINRSGIVGGVNGKTGGWRLGATHNTVGSYRSACELIGPIADRLKETNIEKKDFRTIINRYDHTNTLFYVDPPYIGREKQYAGGFNEQDHRDLAQLLNGIKGKAIVSYYPDPLVTELYGGWHVKEIESKVYSKKVQPGENKPDATELLLFNYSDKGPQ